MSSRPSFSGSLPRLLAAVPWILAAALALPAEAHPGPSGGPSPAVYTVRPPDIFTHNAGLLSLQVTNLGMFGNPFLDDLSAGWRGYEHLYFSGLWIGAIGPDAQPHVSTVAPFELRPELGPIWTVYESFEGIENGRRLSAYNPALADDDGDGLVDEDFQDGLDNDGDGLIDEDFAAAGQQMFSCIYRDDTPEAISQVPDHTPLHVLVRQRSFEWAQPGINEFVGVEFEIRNNGDLPLGGVYPGL